MHECSNSLDIPQLAAARRAVRDAQRQFERSLATWTMDLLALRRAGLTQTIWTSDAADAPWTVAA